MRLLIDTHYLIWLVTDRKQLSVTERAVLTDLDNELFVSAITIWELRTKARAERRRGKFELTLFPPAAVSFCEEHGIGIVPLTAADCTVILPVEPTNNDPFDEMLLVHAQRLGARLLTRDRQLLGHPLAYQL